MRTLALLMAMAMALAACGVDGSGPGSEQAAEQDMRRIEGNPVQVLVHSEPKSIPVSGPRLEQTRWVLRTLAGEEVGPGAGGNPVDIRFLSEDMLAAGFSGCNRFSGSYSLEGSEQHGNPLKLGPVAGTRMACPEGMELERAFLEILARVTAYRLQNDSLVLLGDGEELAMFESL